MKAKPPQPSRGGQFSYYAALAHRLSGLALACFLPIHFLTLGLALEGAANLDVFLAYTDLAIVKLGEWGLVVLLTLHLLLGVRVLLIEGMKTTGLRLGWIGFALLASLILGAIFIALVW
ncbi:MAG: succinate dehydrogenase [Proteobacteria bacterium]|nr:succinate dehydrogenase [Pseudomonadota bacterium]